jgi:hypothetical protein
VDTAVRDAAGAYERHISQTVPVPEGLDLRPLLDPALAA